MPIPRAVAEFNRLTVNRAMRHVAPHLPGMGVVVHQGRRSGRRYRTPVNVFTRDGGYTFALTYGRDSEWARNVLAAGRCELETHGETVMLVRPRVVHDEDRRGVGPIARPLLGLVHVNDFLEVDRAP